MEIRNSGKNVGLIHQTVKKNHFLGFSVSRFQILFLIS